MESMLLVGLGLLGVAVLLLVIDIFVPTAGVLSITALVVSIVGVVLLFRESATWGLIGAMLVVIGGPLIFFFGLQIMPNTPIGRQLVLGSRDDAESDPQPAPHDPLAALIGTEGVVVTDLRPIGSVRIGDQRYDALSDTMLIRAGSKVKITGVSDGTTLRVRPLT